MLGDQAPEQGERGSVVALFAAGCVGLETAKIFQSRGVVPRFVMLNADGNESENRAIANVLPGSRLLWSDDLYAPDTVEMLRESGLDLSVVAWWPYLIREPLLSLPRLGSLNFHPSLLPHNRGKHPNFWSIVERRPFGVTLHMLDRGIDTGDIVYQRQIATDWTDTGQTLYERALREIIELFREHFDEIIQGSFSRAAQDPSAGSFHLARELDAASSIDLDRTYQARELLNLLRARTFAPHPGARFRDGDATYEVRVEIRRLPT